MTDKYTNSKRNKTIVRLFIEGMNYADISRRFGLCQPYVRSIVRSQVIRMAAKARAISDKDASYAGQLDVWDNCRLDGKAQLSKQNMKAQATTLRNWLNLL